MLIAVWFALVVTSDGTFQAGPFKDRVQCEASSSRLEKALRIREVTCYEGAWR